MDSRTEVQFCSRVQAPGQPWSQTGRALWSDVEAQHWVSFATHSAGTLYSSVRKSSLQIPHVEDPVSTLYPSRGSWVLCLASCGCQSALSFYNRNLPLSVPYPKSRFHSLPYNFNSCWTGYCLYLDFPCHLWVDIKTDSTPLGCPSSPSPCFMTTNNLDKQVFAVIHFPNYITSV